MPFTTLARLAPAFALVAASGAAEAATVISDKASFLSLTGADAVVLPDLGAATGNVATVGPLTFSTGAGRDLFIGGATQWSTSIPGEDIAISGNENLSVTSAMPLSAIGFAIDEPTTNLAAQTDCNAPCTASVFAVQFFLGATQVDQVTGITPGGGTIYVGLIADAAFDRIQILDLNGAADNEYFGDFSIAEASAVPIPPAAALLPAGLLGLAAMRRRRDARAAA